jgi:hypothetical protein
MLYRVIQGRGKIQPKPKKYEKEKKGNSTKFLTFSNKIVNIHLTYCTGHVSGIIFIRYAHNMFQE